MFAEQLPAIFIRSAKQRIQPPRGGAGGQSGHDVVGLKPLHRQPGQPQYCQQFFQPRNLGGKIHRHGGAVRFVLGVDLMSESGPAQIQGANEICGFFRAQRYQVTRHPEEGIGGQPLGAGHGWNGMENLKKQRKSIDHHQRLAFGV